MRRFIALLTLLGVWGLPGNAPAAITFDVNQTYAEVNDGTTTFDDTESNTVTAVASASAIGYSSSTTSIFSPLGLLKGTFVQTRLGTVDGRSYGSVSATFQTTVNAYYEVTGSFSNTDGFTSFGSYLFDDVDGDLYDVSHFTFDGPANITLGGDDGDLNLVQGSLTGTLIAGRTYQWFSFAQTDAIPDEDFGASASGFVSLLIVPEFSSAIVWAFVVATMGGLGWWKRRRLID